MKLTYYILHTKAPVPLNIVAINVHSLVGLNNISDIEKAARIISTIVGGISSSTANNQRVAVMGTTDYTHAGGFH